MSNVIQLPTPKRPWRNFLLRNRETGRPKACEENIRLALERDAWFRRYALSDDKEGCRRRLINFGVHPRDNIDWLIWLATREIRSQQERQAPRKRPGVRQ